MEAAFNFLTGPGLVICFVGFLVLSYIILALLRWSFIDPLKNLSIPIMIVGVITFLAKWAVYYTVNYLVKDDLDLFKPFLDNCGDLFLQMGLVIFGTGVLLLVIYKILDVVRSNHQKKKKKESYSKDEEENIEEEDTPIEEDTKEEKISHK